VKAKGVYLYDDHRKKYLDMASGIAVNPLGYRVKAVIKAIKKQMKKYLHLSNYYACDIRTEYAKELVKNSFADKVFFANSGTEANEAAIKLAKKYGKLISQEKYEIASLENGFHGRTIGALSVTGQPAKKHMFEPLLPGVVFAEFNNLASVEALVSEQTCAVMVEPIQGEGGVNAASPSFMQGLRELCREKGILLILDEVQCGLSRTGKFMAYQQYNIQPDIVTMAKALGGGFPIGALLATDEAATGFAPGDHASTFGGNPLACAVGSKVIDIISQPEFLNQVNISGGYLAGRLFEIVTKDERATAIKGMGLLLGIEFSADVKDLVNICLKNGLLLISAGPRVLRFVPPLNVTKAEIDQALDILEKSLQEWNG
jgi:predicted acetylornithine/succinylornithine family transaminase